MMTYVALVQRVLAGEKYEMEEEEKEEEEKLIGRA